MVKLSHKVRSKSQHLVKNKNFRASLFIAIFAVIGASLILFTRAAANNVALEPENATLTTPATKVSDATASGGSAVQFKAATCPAGQTGTPPNCVTTTPGSCGKLVRTSDTCMVQSTAPVLNNPTVYGSPSAPVALNLTTNLSNAIVYGCIAVKANNVHITNVVVNDGADGVHWQVCVGGLAGGNGGSQAALSGGNPSTGTAVTGLVLDHVKVLGNNAKGLNKDGSPDSSITCADCTLQSVDASGTGHVVTALSNVTIKDSIIHDAGCASADGYPANIAQHINGIYADTVTGLVVDNTYIQVTCTYSVTAGFSFNDTYAMGGSLTLTDSYVEGGAGYSLDGPGHGHGHTGPILVTDNVIVSPPLSKGAIGHLPFSTNQTFARNVDQNGNPV